jgi:hypothetical protein
MNRDEASSDNLSLLYHERTTAHCEAAPTPWRVIILRAAIGVFVAADSRSR